MGKSFLKKVKHGVNKAGKGAGKVIKGTAKTTAGFIKSNSAAGLIKQTGKSLGDGNSVLLIVVAIGVVVVVGGVLYTR